MAHPPSSPVDSPTLARFDLARNAVFLLTAFLFFANLGSGSLWDNSEPTYGEIVKELFRTGDWLTLHFNFQPWSIHPPLWFWTAGGSVALLGLTEFALRLPSAIAGLLTVWAVYRAGLRLYGRIGGLIAALAFGSSLEIILLSRLATLDSVLLLFTTVAGLWIFFAIRDGDRRAFWIAVVAAALGTLTKGPVAVVLPVLVLVAYGVWQRSWIVSRGLPWIGGTIAYLLIASSWFAAATLLTGPRFLSDYFGHSNVGRFLHPFENQPGPWWYYIPITIVGFFPWVAFLPKAIKAAWLARGDSERYLLCSTAVPLVFFSLAQTKLPNYIVVVFPAIALLVGRLFADAIRENNLRTLRGALIMLPVALVCFSIGIVVFAEITNPGPFHAMSGYLSSLGAVVLLPAIATLAVTLGFKRVWLAPVGLAVMMAALTTLVAFVLLPVAETFKPMKPFAATVMSYWHPGDRIGIFNASGGYSLLYYTDGGGVTFIATTPGDGDATPQEFFYKKQRVLCVTRADGVAALRRLHLPVYPLTHSGKLWLVSNRPTLPAAVR